MEPNFHANTNALAGSWPRISRLLAGALRQCLVARSSLRDTQAAEEVLPKHINRDTLKAVRDGLDFLARTQAGDGGWHDAGGQAYPVAVSARWPAWRCWPAATRRRAATMPSRSKQVTEYLLSCSTDNG